MTRRTSRCEILLQTVTPIIKILGVADGIVVERNRLRLPVNALAVCDHPFDEIPPFSASPAAAAATLPLRKTGVSEIFTHIEARRRRTTQV